MTEPAGSTAGPAGFGAPVVAAAPANSASDDLTEVVVESEVLRRGHYLTFRVDTIERADGTRAKREVVGHPGAVAILAIDEADNVLMVRQFRIPAGRALLEVPAGTLDVDPLTGAIEDPALAAPRELEEETGYRAGSWRLLTSFWTAPGFATEYMHLYLATDLAPAHENRLGPDEDERLLLERVPWQEAIDRAERGEIADAKSLIALLWLDRLTQPSAPPSEPVVSAEASVAEPAVRVSYAPTIGEAVLAAVTHARRSRAFQVAGLLSAVAAVVSWIGGDVLAGAWFGAVAILLLSGFVLAPIAAIAYRRRSSIVAVPTAFAAGADGLAFSSSAGQSHVPWSTLVRIRETGSFFFFEIGMAAMFVPKRAFSPEQLSEFRRLIAEAGFGPDGRRR
jgi:ADP-ribose pyrophosphatase